MILKNERKKKKNEFYIIFIPFYEGKHSINYSLFKDFFYLSLCILIYYLSLNFFLIATKQMIQLFHILIMKLRMNEINAT